MINKVILVGNLGKKPEVREFEGGRKVANFTVATSERYTNKEGQKVTNTEWHNIEMWDKLADIADRYLDKGSKVYLEGKIKTEQWQDKEGNNRYTTRIRAINLQMLDSKPQDATPSSSAPPVISEAPKAQNNSSENKVTEEDDDLPF